MLNARVALVRDNAIHPTQRLTVEFLELASRKTPNQHFNGCYLLCKYSVESIETIPLNRNGASP